MLLSKTAVFFNKIISKIPLTISNSNITNEQMVKLKNMSMDVKINDGCVIKMQGYKYHIFLNANNSRGRIRFTIAHEIKHIIFDDNDNNEEDEKLTDHFAKILLAPPVLLQYYDCNSVDEIVRRFGVSNEVGNYLLEIKDRRRNAFGKDTKIFMDDATELVGQD